MYFAYSADPRMRINVGIRRRLAPLLDNNRRRVELLNSILFSFPGTPILYYGDEIGMGRQHLSRRCLRRPGPCSLPISVPCSPLSFTGPWFDSGRSARDSASA